jgi:hypothetical protein
MMKELESLKAIAESQIIELHNNLRDERKQKHIYKQQLDEQIQKVNRNTKFIFLFQFFIYRNLFVI